MACAVAVCALNSCGAITVGPSIGVCKTGTEYGLLFCVIIAMNSSIALTQHSVLRTGRRGWIDRIGEQRGRIRLRHVVAEEWAVQ